MKKLFSGVRLQILVLLFICIIFLFLGTGFNYSSLKPQRGILDLRKWNPSSENKLVLSGDWEFYWKKLLTADDFQKSNQLKLIYADIPKVWNSYRMSGRYLTGFGHATYRLHVKGLTEKLPLSIRINPLSTSYRCYIDEELVAESGTVGTEQQNAKPGYNAVTANFISPGKEFDIILQVSNYTYSRGGAWSDLLLGTQEQLQRYDSFLKYKDGLVIGCLFMMSIYFLCYLLMYPEDRKNLSFLLMCLILMLRTALNGDFLIVQLFPGISYRLIIWFTYFTVIWFPLIVFRLVKNFTGSHGNLSKPLFAYAGLMSLLTALLPVSLYTGWIRGIEAVDCLILSVTLLASLRANLTHQEGAQVILYGILIVSLAGIHDMLYQASYIHSMMGELSPVGLIIFMFMLFYVRAKKNARIRREVLSLTEEMAEKLKQEHELTERLFLLDKWKDEFLINTSYELRTPLNGISNITRSLLQGIGGPPNQVHKRNLEIILDTASQTLARIDDLLDISLLRSGGMMVMPVPVNLHSLVSNMLAIYHHLTKDDSIKIVNRIPADFPAVLADEERLRQIIHNLIGNSLKSTESGEIMIHASNDSEQACICIEDTGAGIAPELLSDIFYAFERVDGVLKRKHEGAGLGLYTTKQLIELQGGYIWITSEVGKGTQTYFTLPLSTEFKTSEDTPDVQTWDSGSVAAEEPGLPHSSYRILAVEDDAANLQAMINILQLNKYYVKAIRSGRDALYQLESGSPFELVILDSEMPELSSFEILETIRKKYSQIELPVLMITPKTLGKAKTLCFKLGANDYLAKPFEPEELLARVSGLVRLKHTVSRLVTAELSFLQAQIKPHFIHNTLNAISCMCTKDPGKAKSLILDLSDYLRGCFQLDDNGGMTTLVKELELVRAYLSIEQARFKERLQVFYHIPDEADCPLPLLTLQPLVENALRHGILCKGAGGEIHITAVPETERMKIQVRDNGIGMDSKLISQFLEGKQKHSGVGLGNINRRLITRYGEGLHIESIPNHGTSIYFYVPL